MGNNCTTKRVSKECVGLAAVTIAGSLTFAPASHAATNGVTALLVGGQGSYAVLTEEQMSTAFGGYFANYDQRVSVPFPGDADFSLSIPEGATNLYNAVYAHEATVGTPLTIGGVSKGAPSVIEALRRLEADRENTTDGKEPPSPDQMNVMIYGAPSRIYYAGVRYRPDLPVTPYDVVLVSAEYDGVADMPDNLFNVLAVLNAIQGADMLHVDAAFNTDFVNDPMHYKVETNKDGGKVTTVIIPYTDPIVPLLHPMLEAGADPVQLAKLSAILKPIIDAGYTRNNPIQKKKWTDGVITIPLPRAATSGSATGTPTTETSTTASSTTTSSTTTRSIASGGGSDSSSSGSGSVQALTVEKPADTAEPVEKPADTATKKTTKKTSSLNASKDSEDRRADSVTRIAKRLGQRITNRLGRDKSGASAGAASSSSGSTGSDSGASGGSSDQGD